MDHRRTSVEETISLAGCASSLSKPWKQREGAFAFDRRELPIMVDLLKSAAAKVIGAEKVNEFNQIMPGGDDAAYFQQKVRGVYWLRSLNKQGFWEGIFMLMLDAGGSVG